MLTGRELSSLIDLVEKGSLFWEEELVLQLVGLVGLILFVDQPRVCFDRHQGVA